MRPLFSRLTPHGAVSARSPLVSMIFPSQKDKINNFNDEYVRKDSRSPESKFNTNNYVKRSELEKIVELETRKLTIGTDHNLMGSINSPMAHHKFN